MHRSLRSIGLLCCLCRLPLCEAPGGIKFHPSITPGSSVQQSSSRPSEPSVTQHSDWSTLIIHYKKIDYTLSFFLNAIGFSYQLSPRKFDPRVLGHLYIRMKKNTIKIRNSQNNYGNSYLLYKTIKFYFIFESGLSLEA
jgi:hypothetical protein